MSRIHCGYVAAYIWYARIAYCVELSVGLNSQLTRNAGIPDVRCRITTMDP